MKFAAIALVASATAKTSVYMTADDAYDIWHNGTQANTNGPNIGWKNVGHHEWDSETDVIAIHVWEKSPGSPSGLMVDVTYGDQETMVSNPANWRCIYSTPDNAPDGWTTNDFDDSKWREPIEMNHKVWFNAYGKK